MTVVNFAVASKIEAQTRDGSSAPDRRPDAILFQRRYTKATVHGFRSTFSTVANESELWSPDAIEKALAHSPKNAVRAAYYRGMRLEERRRLMQWWSDKLDEWEAAGKAKQAPATVTTIDTDLSDLLS